jgi:hypothetical protein
MTDGVVVVIFGIAVAVVVKGNLRLLPLLWKGACSALRRPRVDTEYTVVVAVVVVAGPPVVVVVPLAAGAAVVAGLLAI